MGQAEFPPDTVEEQIPDLDTAERLLAEKDPSFLRYVQLRRQQFERTFGEEASDTGRATGDEPDGHAISVSMEYVDSSLNDFGDGRFDSVTTGRTLASGLRPEHILP